LISAISLASETELFIDQLLEGRATPTFAQGHLDYLRHEATRAADALQEAHAGEEVNLRAVEARWLRSLYCVPVWKTERNPGTRFLTIGNRPEQSD
jgi:hypothetical protein